MEQIILQKKQIIVGVIIIICFILLLEIGLRYYAASDFCPWVINDVYENSTYDEKGKICGEVEIQYFQNYTIQPNQRGNSFSINNHGFRGEDITLEKPENTYRIFLVGSSATFGAGSLSNDLTLAGFLQEKFDEIDTGKKIEVINAAVPGSFSLPQTLLIKNKIYDFEPDLMIIISGWNDLNLPYSAYNNTRLDEVSVNRGLWYVVRDIMSDYRTPNVLSSIFVMTKIYSPFNSVTSPFDNSLIDEKSELWKMRWADICEKNQEMNIDTIFVLQPFTGTGKKSLSYQERGYYVFFDHETRVKEYEHYAEKLEELKTKCTHISDFRDIFDDKSFTIFRDRSHLGQIGTEIMSDKLLQVSLPLVESRVK